MGHKPVCLGDIFSSITNNPGVDSFTFDAATDALHLVFTPRESMVVTDISFLLNTKSGTPPNHTGGIQLLDLTTGIGDGTYLNSGNAKNSFVVGSAGTQVITLDASATLTMGTPYAVVLSPDSAPGANTSSWYYRIGASFNATTNSKTVNGGVASGGFTNIPIVGLKTADGWFGCPITAQASDGSQATYGNRLVVPVGVKSIVGLRYYGRTSSVEPAASFDAHCFVGGGAGDTTPTVTVTVDKSQLVSLDLHIRNDIYFDAPVTVSSGDIVRIAVQGTDTAQNVGLNNFSFTSNTYLYSMPLGTGCYHTTRTSGNWTDTDSKVAWIFPIVELIDTAGSVGTTGSKLNKGFN